MSRHLQRKTSCPLYSRKRTCAVHSRCPLRANSGHRTPSASRRFNNDLMHCIWRRVSRNRPVNRQPIPLLSAIYCLDGDCLLNRGDVRNAQRCDRWGDLLRNSQNAGNAHNIWERIQSDILHAHHSTPSSKDDELTRCAARGKFR